MSTLTLPYADGNNYAPIKPLLPKMREAQEDKSVEIGPDWAKKLLKTLQTEEEHVWRDQYLLDSLIVNFAEGRQLLNRDRRTGAWRAIPLPTRTDSPVFSLNMVGFYVDAAKSKWVGSSTDIKWRASSDEDKQQGQAKAATNVQGFFERKIYTQSFKQLEATRAIVGRYARYYYYTKEQQSYARRERTEQRQVQFGESTYFCPDCGSGGPIPALSAGTGPDGSASDQPLQGTGGLPSTGLAANPSNAGSAPAFSGIESPTEERAEQLIQRQNPTAYQAGEEQEEYDQASAQFDNGIRAETGQADGALPTQDQTADSYGAGVCPECGSANIETQEAPSFPVEAVVGHELYKTGSIVCEGVQATELKYDLACLPQDSPFLLRSRRVRTTVLQSKFPYIKFGQKHEDIPGLEVQEKLKKSSSGSSARMYTSTQEEGKEETTDFIQLWLDPDLYSRLRLKESFETQSGMMLEAGTNLIDIFPDGMYLCFIAGIDGVIEARNEHHKDYWVGGVLRQRASSGLGIGYEDIVEGQRKFNISSSLVDLILRTCAAPATLIDESLMPNGTSAYIGNPSKTIPVKTNRLEGRPLNSAVFQLQGQPPAQAFFVYLDRLNNFMQLASRVVDFSGGLPGVENDTATGAEITNAAAQALFGPQLGLKAEVDRRGAEIILDLFRKNCFDEIYVALSGKRGKQDGVWLKAADIQLDMYAEVVPESYMPQTNLERRKRLQAMLVDVGGLPGLKMAMEAMPSVIEKLAETYDVDFGAEDYTAAAETAAQRIEQMKAAVPQLQIMQQSMPSVQMAEDPMNPGQMIPMPVDPEVEAGQMLLSILNPPIEIEEIGHLAAVNVYRSWLTEDAGKEAPTELRAGVKAAIYQHLEGLVAEAQLSGMMGMAAQPPMPMQEEGAGGPEGPKNKQPQGSQMKGGSARSEMRNQRKQQAAGVAA